MTGIFKRSKMVRALPKLAIIALAVTASAGRTAADQGSNIPQILTDPATMKAHPLPDYSYAGYGFGIAPLPDAGGTIINVTDYGAIPDDGRDDSQAVLRALAAANAVNGKVTLQFPAGRTQISEILRITRSDIVLNGLGAHSGGSELFFLRPLKIVDLTDDMEELRDYLVREKKIEYIPEENIHHPFTEYSWAGGFIFVGPEGTRPVSYDGSKDKRDPVLTDVARAAQFSRELIVADGSQLKVGQVVQIQWFSDKGADSAILKSMYGDTKLPIGSHHWTFPNRPVVGQTTRIAAIRGRRVTIGDPLMHAIGPQQPAVVANWRHLTNVGIQNLRFQFPESPSLGHHQELGYNGIYFTGTFDGWMRNLTFDKADSAILTDNAASLTIADIVTSGNRAAHYAVHVGAVHNVLVRDLRVENPVIHPVTVNTRSTRSVVLRADVRRDGVIDQHSGSNHQNLFDQITLRVSPVATGNDDARQWSYRLWRGGGAPYWKPGHGLYNTTWNTRLIFDETVSANAEVQITSGLEGPGQHLVGMSGNRRIHVSYDPEPYAEGINLSLTAVPSLYEYQLRKRRMKLNAR